MDFSIVDATKEPQWNDWVLGYPESTVFHSAEWSKVLAETYNYRSQCGILHDGSGVVAILPAMRIDKLMHNPRGVCLPFSDECAPLLRTGLPLSSIVKPMLEFARQKNWSRLEIRAEAESWPGAVATDTFAYHDLALEGDEQAQFSTLSNSHRRNIRKAWRNKVKVVECRGIDAMRQYYWLHCLTRRMHGLFPQPRRFFDIIHQRLIEPGHGTVMLAHWQDRPIAGAVYFERGGNALFKFGASDPGCRSLGAGHLLMWEAIRRFRLLGMTGLSLGRSDSDALGLRRFKRGWGAAELWRRYYAIGVDKPFRPGRPSPRATLGFAVAVRKRMPVRMLQTIGRVVYRHMA